MAENEEVNELKERQFLKSSAGPIKLGILCKNPTCIGYDISVLVEDKKGRKNAVKGFLPYKSIDPVLHPLNSSQESNSPNLPKTRVKKFTRIESQTIKICLDKEIYQAGDFANITVESPFSPFDGNNQTNYPL